MELLLIITQILTPSTVFRNVVCLILEPVEGDGWDCNKSLPQLFKAEGFNSVSGSTPSFEYAFNQSGISDVVSHVPIHSGSGYWSSAAFARLLMINEAMITGTSRRANFLSPPPQQFIDSHAFSLQEMRVQPIPMSTRNGATVNLLTTTPFSWNEHQPLHATIRRRTATKTIPIDATIADVTPIVVNPSGSPVPGTLYTCVTLVAGFSFNAAVTQ